MSWVRNIKGALTIPVLMQYVFLYQRLQSVHLEPGTREWLRWRWSADGIYSSCSVYAALLLGQASALGAKELWKTKAPNSCRFFIWLVLLGRCWTNERRFRHGLCSSSSCTLCCKRSESIDHLAVQCVFAREVWFRVLRGFGWQQFVPTEQDFFAIWWSRVRKQVIRGPSESV
jgi:hypothetical protein